MLDETSLTTQHTRTKESCKRKCQEIDLCHAFVYDTSTNYCNLHSKMNSDKNIKEAAGKVFGLTYCSGKKYDPN